MPKHPDTLIWVAGFVPALVNDVLALNCWLLAISKKKEREKRVFTTEGTGGHGEKSSAGRAIS